MGHNKWLLSPPKAPSHSAPSASVTTHSLGVHTFSPEPHVNACVVETLEYCMCGRDPWIPHVPWIPGSKKGPGMLPRALLSATGSSISVINDPNWKQILSGKSLVILPRRIYFLIWTTENTFGRSGCFLHQLDRVLGRDRLASSPNPWKGIPVVGGEKKERRGVGAGPISEFKLVVEFTKPHRSPEF